MGATWLSAQYGPLSWEKLFWELYTVERGPEKYKRTRGEMKVSLWSMVLSFLVASWCSNDSRSTIFSIYSGNSRYASECCLLWSCGCVSVLGYLRPRCKMHKRFIIDFVYTENTRTVLIALKRQSIHGVVQAQCPWACTRTSLTDVMTGLCGQRFVSRHQSNSERLDPLDMPSRLQPLENA